MLGRSLPADCCVDPLIPALTRPGDGLAFAQNSLRPSFLDGEGPCPSLGHPTTGPVFLSTPKSCAARCGAERSRVDRNLRGAGTEGRYPVGGGNSDLWTTCRLRRS